MNECNHAWEYVEAYLGDIVYQCALCGSIVKVPA